jgi:aminocarboxymuconate-semialdehyde decarboxylase
MHAGNIDTHTHIVPKNLPSFAGAVQRDWPSIEHISCGHANIMISGKLFRSITDAAWSVPRRIADIAEMGISRQAISPMPELLSYWLPLDSATLLLRHVNETTAAMVTESPTHLIGMGAVPLQDVDAAVVELRRNVELLNLRAVEVGSNINGVPIGDPCFEPFFEAAAALGVAVFVHALRASGKERLVGPPMLEQIVGFPGEIALAAASLITSGILVRHPHLRIAFSHGGGGLASLLARMEHFWLRVPKFGELLQESPMSTARRAFYDLVVFEPVVVRFLVDLLGASQLLLGSDFPFGPYERSPVDLLRRAGLSEAETMTITQLNAPRYLGLLV